MFYRPLFLFVPLLLACVGASFVVIQKVNNRKKEMAAIELRREHGRILWAACGAYSKLHKGRYPDATHWENQLATVLKINHAQMTSIVLPPASEYSSNKTRRFSLNAQVANQPVSRFINRSHTILFFESNDVSPDSCHKVSDLAPGQLREKADAPVAVDVSGWSEINGRLMSTD